MTKKGQCLYNYSAPAMKDLAEFAREADFFGHHKSAAFLDDIVGMLRKAVKFMLPDGGRPFETERPLSPDDSDLLKLPSECFSLRSREHHSDFPV